LAEVPELAATLQLLVDADRLIAGAVSELVRLQESALAETATGVGLDQWLAAVGRRMRTDRRMLLTAAQVCRRLPSLHAAFVAGAVSWSQVRTIACEVRTLPQLVDDRLDGELAAAIDGAADADPDALARVVGWVADTFRTRPEPTVAPEADVFVLQPRLDGSGGTAFGNFGPVGFAQLEAATDPGPTGTRIRDRFGDAPDPEPARRARRSAGQARAERLLALCSAAGAGGPARPTVLARLELASLLGGGRLPGQLLTHLAGGTMRVDAATAERLADDGCDLRLIVVEGGRVVGVGTKTARPPGWLREAILALHEVCSEPGCVTAARVCDLDHAIPAADDGPTDVANLAPLCATANHRKEADGWTASQTGDGVRVWSHPRSGLRVRTLPATWRPPPGHRRRPEASPAERRLHRLLARQRPRADTDRDHGEPPPPPRPDGLPF
jgi:hypothetical protein